MRRLICVCGAMLLVLAGSGTAAAQRVNYIISQHGQKVGAAEVRVNPGKDSLRYTMQVKVAQGGLAYALSGTEEVTREWSLRRAQMSGTVNGHAVQIDVTRQGTSGAGTAYNMDISADGKTTKVVLPPHPINALVADFDPVGLEALLQSHAFRYGREVWVMVPKDAGWAEPVVVTTFADEQGTLNGYPVVVHHVKAKWNGEVTDLFSNDEHELLQAELPQQGFALIREGFVLTPSAKPAAPSTQAQ